MEDYRERSLRPSRPMSLFTININCDNAAVLAAIADLKETTMTALEDLNAKADALNAQIATNNADIEALIALAKSKGASDAEIAAVTAKLDTGLQSLSAEDAAAEGVAQG